METRQPEPTAEGSQGRRFYLVNFCLRRLLNKRLKQPPQHQVPFSRKQSCSHYLKPVPPGHNQPRTLSAAHGIQTWGQDPGTPARAAPRQPSTPASPGRARLQVRRVAETASLPREGWGCEKKLKMIAWLYLSNGGKRPRKQHITESVPNG